MGSSIFFVDGIVLEDKDTSWHPKVLEGGRHAFIDLSGQMSLLSDLRRTIFPHRLDLDGSGVIDYTEFCAAGIGERVTLEARRAGMAGSATLWARRRWFGQTTHGLGVGMRSRCGLRSVVQELCGYEGYL